MYVEITTVPCHPIKSPAWLRRTCFLPWKRSCSRQVLPTGSGELPQPQSHQCDPTQSWRPQWLVVFVACCGWDSSFIQPSPPWLVCTGTTMSLPTWLLPHSCCATCRFCHLNPPKDWQRVYWKQCNDDWWATPNCFIKWKQKSVTLSDELVFHHSSLDPGFKSDSHKTYFFHFLRPFWRKWLFEARSKKNPHNFCTKNLPCTKITRLGGQRTHEGLMSLARLSCGKCQVQDQQHPW